MYQGCVVIRMSGLVSEESCESRMKALTKLVKANADIEVIRGFDNEWQVKAYDRLKKSQERQKIISLVLKIATEINVVVGAVATLVSVFV